MRRSSCSNPAIDIKAHFVKILTLPLLVVLSPREMGKSWLCLWIPKAMLAAMALSSF